MADPATSVVLDPSSFSYVVGIDLGSEACCFTVLTPQKQVVIKPRGFANAASGFHQLQAQLARLERDPSRIVVGLEATSRYGENLFHFLQQQGYHLCLLHPRQTHEFAKQRGLRAKTDRLDAATIARVLLSGEARVGYVPTEHIASYRELVRLHTRLSDEIACDKNEIQGLLVVLTPRVHPGLCRSLPHDCYCGAPGVSQRKNNPRRRSGCHCGYLACNSSPQLWA